VEPAPSADLVFHVEHHPEARTCCRQHLARYSVGHRVAALFASGQSFLLLADDGARVSESGSEIPVSMPPYAVQLVPERVGNGTIREDAGRGFHPASGGLYCQDPVSIQVIHSV
jgi:hypothetical protein